MTSNTIDPGALAAALRRGETQNDGRLLDASLQRLVDSCVDLFEVSGCGLMLADDAGELRYSAASDRPARDLEQAQLELGSGPCIDAYVSDRIVASDDVRTDGRWPRVAAALAGSQVRAVLGAPVRLSGITVGSLDVYRTTAGPWDGSRIEALGQYGRVVETMLSAAVAADNAGEMAGQLTHALRSRIPVERAVGFLMCREGLDAAAAFQHLRAEARSRRVRVAEIAHELLGREDGSSATGGVAVGRDDTGREPTP